jgi:hypothetical protein
VKAADVNGDGQVDLVTGSQINGQSLVILTNDGSGGFVSASTPPVSGWSIFLALADVNTDGKVDIIYLHYFTNIVDILTNNGSGIFSVAGTTTVGANTRWIEAADLNGDHGVDLISADANANTLTLLMNTADTNRPIVGAAFHGDGSGLTNLSLSPGANVALLNTNQTFTGVNNFNNAANSYSGNFTGDGSGLTSLTAANVSAGTLADARLSGNVALLNASQTFSGVVTVTNAGNSFVGNGEGLTSLSAGNITSGTVADARLSANVALLYASQTFTGVETFNNVGNSFIGNGAGLIALSAVNISSGTLPDARLSGNVALHAGGNVFSGGQTFNGQIRLDTIDGFSQSSAGTFYIDAPFIVGGRLTVLTNGNVGIGTNSPISKLHVIGGVTFSTGSIAPNQTVSWSPGQASWSFTSDRNAKTRIEPLDPQSVLEKVMSLPINEWSYLGFEQRHIGPMAQDFHAAFPLNESETTLNDADLHGVALAAIQGLNQKLKQELEEKESELRQLKQRLEALEQSVKEKQNPAR